MEASYKVSVIIPSYNAGNYIADSVESVLQQTYPSFEVIVVDDGSTDHTQEVLARFGDRIRYIYQENAGPAPARNTGIRHARGDLIAFNDSDDLWLPQKLEKQVAYLQAHPDVALIYTNLYLFSNEGIQSPVKFRPYYGNGFLPLLRRNYIGTSTVLVKRSCFDKLGLFDERPEIEAAEDYEMWLRITQNFKIGCIEEKLAQHRVRKSGHSRVLDRQIQAGIFVKRRFLESLPDTEEMKAIKALCWREFYEQAAYAYFYKEEFARAREQFRLAFKYNGLNSKLLLYYLATFLPKTFLHLLRSQKLALTTSH